jgi:hypothetical protein
MPRKSLSEQAKFEAEQLVSNYSVIYTTFLIDEMQKALKKKIKVMYDV